MKMDAVYLVAPKPKPMSMPTRRACILAGVTLTTGVLLGGTCGYSIGASAVQEVIPWERGSGTHTDPSGDIELDELRRLAVDAPIAELVEKAVIFLGMCGETRRADPVLWRGVERLSRAMMEASRPVSDSVVDALVVLIEGDGFPPELRLQDHLQSLRELRMRPGRTK